jgi:hypothetical protein
MINSVNFMKWIVGKNDGKRFLMIFLFVLGITLPFFMLNFAVENTTSGLIKNEMDVQQFYDAELYIPADMGASMGASTITDNPLFDGSIERYDLVGEVGYSSVTNATCYNTSIYCLGMYQDYLDFLSEKFWQGRRDLLVGENDVCLSDTLASKLSLHVNDSIEITCFFEQTANGTSYLANSTRDFVVRAILPFTFFVNTTRCFESGFLSDYLNAGGNVVFLNYDTLKSMIPTISSWFYINYRKSSYSTTSIISYSLFLQSLFPQGGASSGDTLSVAVNNQLTDISTTINNEFSTYLLLLVSYFMIFFFISRKFLDSTLDDENLEFFLYNIKGYSKRYIHARYLYHVIPPAICGMVAAIGLTTTAGLVLFPIVSKALLLDSDISYLTESMAFGASFLVIITIVLIWSVNKKILTTTTLSSIKAEIKEQLDMKWTMGDTIWLVFGLSGVLLLILATFFQNSTNHEDYVLVVQGFLLAVLPLSPVALTYASVKLLLSIKMPRAYRRREKGHVTKKIHSILVAQNRKFYRKDYLAFTILTGLIFSSSFFFISSSLSYQNTVVQKANNYLGTDYLVLTDDLQGLIDGVPRLATLTYTPMAFGIPIMSDGSYGQLDAIGDNFTRTCLGYRSFLVSLASNMSVENFTLQDHEILIDDTYAEGQNLSIGSKLDFGMIVSGTFPYENATVAGNGTYVVVGIFHGKFSSLALYSSDIIGSYDYFNSIRIAQENNTEWFGQVFVNLGPAAEKIKNRDALTADLREYLGSGEGGGTGGGFNLQIYDIYSQIALFDDQSPWHYYMIGGFSSIFLILIALISQNLLFHKKRAREFSHYLSRGFNKDFIASLVQKERQKPLGTGTLIGIALGIINSVVFLSVSQMNTLQGSVAGISGVLNYYPYLIMGILFVAIFLVLRLTTFMYFNHNAIRTQNARREVI